ncbi:MAG: hypothetical protein FWC01_05765 [Treponema sp.]|nr:hypothetical protein [Treponema sp.]MCL2237360.1 hypothetical protein [Treponema sp.]
MENRNKSKLWLIIAMIAFFGFIVSACGDGENNTSSGCTHEWNAYLQTAAPTCTEAGIKTRTCKKCSDADTETETGDPAQGHNWEYIEGSILPTCEEGGHGSRDCIRSGCGISDIDVDFSALGHKWGEWDVTEPPNCVFAGIKTKECEACEKEETDEVGIDENEHDIEVLDGVAPTCLLDGYGTIKCKRDTCDYLITGDTLEKRGHHFTDHWVEVDAATCTTAGLDERFCTHECGEEGNSETRVNGAFGHSWENWVTTATFLTEGIKARICKNNSSHIETIDEDPLPITSTADWVTAINELNGKTGSYTLTVNGDIGVTGSTAISFGETKNDSLNVTLKGSGKLFLTSQGNLLRIDTNQKLIINSEHLILQGLRNGHNGATQNNNSSLLLVNNGTVELMNGYITGNVNAVVSGVNNSGYGGGVFILNSGRFVMYSGEINDNTSTSSLTEGTLGGGVYVDQEGTLIMHGGKINGNVCTSSTFYAYGGGVYVKQGGTFTINNGKISDNMCYNTDYTGVGTKRYGYGSGIAVSTNATFLMYGGEISGNKEADYGGGMANSGGSIRIINGIIYGINESNATLRNTVSGDFISTAIGGAVLFRQGTGGTTQYGTFTGETWNGTNIPLTTNGSNAYTNNTIRVVNGVLQ